MSNDLDFDGILDASKTLGQSWDKPIVRPKPSNAEATALPQPRERREPFRGTDRKGKAIVYVPLAGGKHVAKLYAEDFDRIMADGYSDQWHYLQNNHGRSYVRVWLHGKSGTKESIHRLVMQASPNQAVVFRTSDTLDLRHGNLSIRTKKKQQAPFVDAA